MADGVMGLTLAKINNTFHVDVKNSRWDVKRALVQHDTGAGPRNATGLEHPSGSFDEVIPQDKQLNVRALKQFSVEIYDKATRSIVVAAFARCDWDDVSGSADTGAATTGRAWTWKGEEVVKI
jgi:hypothetical protein